MGGFFVFGIPCGTRVCMEFDGMRGDGKRGSSSLLDEVPRDCLAEPIEAKIVADVAESRDIGRSPFSSSSLVERQGTPSGTHRLAGICQRHHRLDHLSRTVCVAVHGSWPAPRADARSFATVVGGAAASLVLMALSSLGLGAALAASETGFLVLKIVGALYLIYLGILGLAGAIPAGGVRCRGGRRADPRQSHALATVPQGLRVSGSAIRRTCCLRRAFPNFIDMAQPQLPQFVVLALTWLVVRPARR